MFRSVGVLGKEDGSGEALVIISTMTGLGPDTVSLDLGIMAWLVACHVPDQAEPETHGADKAGAELGKPPKSRDCDSSPMAAMRTEARKGDASKIRTSAAAAVRCEKAN